MVLPFGRSSQISRVNNENTSSSPNTTYGSRRLRVDSRTSRAAGSTAPDLVVVTAAEGSSGGGTGVASGDGTGVASGGTALSGSAEGSSASSSPDPGTSSNAPPVAIARSVADRTPPPAWCTHAPAALVRRSHHPAPHRCRPAPVPVAHARLRAVREGRHRTRVLDERPAADEDERAGGRQSARARGVAVPETRDRPGCANDAPGPLSSDVRSA